MGQSSMSSILDIDLDYFEFFQDPVARLRKLLKWGDRPVDFTAEKHHRFLKQWKALVKRGAMSAPTHILHVDQHHDMMDQRATPNIANFMYHVMRHWPECQLHWVVDRAIDSPDMWIEDDEWEVLAPRFSFGPHKPRGWPKPDTVSVCSSPEFVNTSMQNALLKCSGEFNDGLGAPSPKRVK